MLEERKSSWRGRDTRDSLMRREGAKEKAREKKLGRETWRAIIHKELIPEGSEATKTSRERRNFSSSMKRGGPSGGFYAKEE